MSVSPDDPYAVKSSLQERATALDDGAVTVLQVDPVADTNSWDDVKANNLPPRPDEHCAGTVNPAESSELPNSAAADEYWTRDASVNCALIGSPRPGAPPANAAKMHLPACTDACADVKYSLACGGTLACQRLFQSSLLVRRIHLAFNQCPGLNI